MIVCALHQSFLFKDLRCNLTMNRGVFQCASRMHRRSSCSSHGISARSASGPAACIASTTAGVSASRALKGTVWITQDRDVRDIILSAGQSFVLDRNGVALVFAFREASVLVGQPGG